MGIINKVFITGSSELPNDQVPLVRELGQRIMTETGFVIVTGGLVSKGHNFLPAMDGILVQAACEELVNSSQSPESRIVTMLPESQDRDRQSFKRIHAGTVVKVSYAGLRTRRFSMVLTSDVVVGICGADSTREVLDLAYIAGKPFLPLPTTGGTALEMWDKHKDALVKRFHITNENLLALYDAKNPSRVVSTCLSLLKCVLRPRCFVAMSFTDHPVPTAYEAIHSSAEESGYQVVRIDQEIYVGNIVEAVWDAIQHSDVMIVDLTNQRPNVFYELGIAHALNKPTIMITYSHNGLVPDNIPFDIRVQRVLPYGTDQSLRLQLKKHLPIFSDHRIEYNL